MADKGQFGTKIFGYTLYGNPTNQYQPFSHAPSPLISSEGSVAFQTPRHGVWAHGPLSGFQVPEVNTLPGSSSDYASIGSEVTMLVEFVPRDAS